MAGNHCNYYSFGVLLMAVTGIKEENNVAGIVFSIESWHPAAERISECFAYFDARTKVIDLSKYCDALDTIGIIPFSGPNKHMSDWKERKYVSWSRREADIRLRIDFDTFVKSSRETQRDIVKEIIIKSLEIIKHKCDAKKLRFDLDDMLYDMFPDE